jgi:hypothetical protein
VPLSTKTQTGLLAITIVSGLAICGGVLLLFVFLLSPGRERDAATHQNDAGKRVGLGEGIGKGKPTASNEGTTWTLPDLAKHLEEKGAIKADKVNYATPFGTPLAEFVVGKDVVLNIIHAESAQRAKDIAAARGKEASFGWGRFAISGDRPVVEAAKRALGAD